MHRLFITIVLALRNLTLHKLRVLLTILGLIFGVSSVIAMLAIAEGASLEAQRQIAALGATNVIIRSMKPPSDVNPSKQQNSDSYIFQYGVTTSGGVSLIGSSTIGVGSSGGGARCFAIKSSFLLS